MGIHIKFLLLSERIWLTVVALFLLHGLFVVLFTIGMVSRR
jgi:hypothetical protein